MARKFTKYPQGYVKASQTDKVYKLTGLIAALSRFNLNGDYAKSGHWIIAKGGYDLDWQLYYDEKPVIDCVSGTLENDNLPSTDFENIAKVIVSVYPDVKVGDSAKKSNYPRYDVLLGFNTKQLWVYDNEEDVYIDPPAEVLDNLPAWNMVDGSEEAEAELYRIVNEEKPDWLFDEDYWYDGDTGI